MAYGQSGHFAACFQNSYGTTFTGSLTHLPIISESIAETIDQLVENNLYAHFGESPYHEGMHTVRGEVRCEAHPIFLGVGLKAAFGQVQTSAVGSVFTHVFWPAGQDFDGKAALPPLTLEIHRDVGSAFLYGDMLANDLTLEIAQGQLLTMNLGLLGGRTSNGAASTPAFPGGRPWSWDVVSASLDGVSASQLRQLSLRFENQLTPLHTLSSGKSPGRIKREGPQRVQVEGNMLLEDQVWFQKYLAQSESRLLVTFTGQAVGSGYNAKLVLDVPRLRFSQFSPQLSGPGQLEVAFTANGMFDTTSGYAMQATLTNTQPAY